MGTYMYDLLCVHAAHVQTTLYNMFCVKSTPGKGSMYPPLVAVSVPKFLCTGYVNHEYNGLGMTKQLLHVLICDRQ